MTNMIHAALPAAAQQFNVSRPAKAHDERKNNSSQFDKGYYRAKDFVHSSIIPARLNLVKSQLQSLIEQGERRRAKPALDFAWFKPARQVPTPRTARQQTVDCAKVAPLLLAAGPQPVALLAERSIAYQHRSRALIERALALREANGLAMRKTPGQVLKQAAERKQSIQEAQLVVQYADPQIQPATPVVAPNGVSYRVGRSPTPGLPETISTKETAAILAAARINHPEWLIGSSKRHNGACPEPGRRAR